MHDLLSRLHRFRVSLTSPARRQACPTRGQQHTLGAAGCRLRARQSLGDELPLAKSSVRALKAVSVVQHQGSQGSSQLVAAAAEVPPPLVFASRSCCCCVGRLTELPEPAACTQRIR